MSPDYAEDTLRTRDRLGPLCRAVQLRRGGRAVQPGGYRIVQFALHERADGQATATPRTWQSAPATAWETCELTILMPCLNEAETLARCIAKARGFLIRSGIDRRGADRRQRQHRRLAADRRGRMARASSRSREKGYGSALLGGIRAARGRYVIMGDSDDSYDFSRSRRFRREAARRLPAGHGQPLPGRHRARRHAAAAPLSRQSGADAPSAACSSAAPAATSTAACAASTAQAILALDLQAPGMEFASEMVVKATHRTAAHRRGADDAVARRPLAPAAPARAGATAGGTCASCCCSARAGCSCYPGAALFAGGPGDDGRGCCRRRALSPA